MMRCYFTLIILIAISITMQGCSFSTGYTDQSIKNFYAQAELSKQSVYYLALPADYKDNNNAVPESAVQTQKALQKAMEEHNIKNIAATLYQSLEQATQTATENNADYLVWLEILQWQDPDTFLQTAPDKGAVMLKVYDAKTGTLLRSDAVECSGKPTTVYHIGVHGPSDCLCKSFSTWTNKATQ